MKLKSLLLALFFALQTLVTSAALAWSPLDGAIDAVDKMQRCYFTVASSGDDEEPKKKQEEEEEEPECD